MCPTKAKEFTGTPSEGCVSQPRLFVQCQRTVHSFPIVHFFQTLLSRLAVFVVQYHIEGGKDALLPWRGKGAMWVRRSSSRFIFMLNG
jgi:hypothetical protein